MNTIITPKPSHKLRITLLALMLALFALPANLWADDQAYLHFSNDGKTLTFFYDSNKQDSDYCIDDYVEDVEDDISIPKWLDDDNIENITKVVFDKSFAKATPTNCSFWFGEMTSLTDIEGLEYFNTSAVKNMSGMFTGCSSLTSLDLSTFNTQNVTDMSYMFSFCQNLKTINLSLFNTSNVEDMNQMFSYCYNLTSLDLSSFDTKNVTDMSGMFGLCQGLTYINLSSFNTSNVEDLTGMFVNCLSLTTLNLTSFNTQKVNKFDLMFQSCSSLLSIFVSDGFVLSSGCSGSNMFTECTSLIGFDDSKTDLTMANADNGYFTMIETSATAWVDYDETTKTLSFHYDEQRNSSSNKTYDIPTNTTDSPAWLTHKDDVEHVVIDESFGGVLHTSCHSWFEGMTKLTSFDGLLYFNTLNVTDMSSMFKGCNSVSTIDLSSFNTANVTDMSNMFADCSSLTTIYVSDMFIVADGCKGDDMFKNCINLPNYDDSKIGKEMASIKGYFIKKSIMWVEYQDDTKTMTFHYNGKMDETEATKKYKVKKVDFPEWYYSIRNDVENVVIEPAFADARPTTCLRWFYYMQKLTDIEGLEYLNTSEVTNMQYMFGYCNSLKAVDVSHFDTRNVTTMENMFTECKALKTLDLSTFNTEKVTNMQYMFSKCSSLKTLDLYGFDTSAATNCSSMFYYNSSLEKIYVSDKFKITGTSDNMFYSCIKLPNYNTDNVDATMANYTTGYLLKKFGSIGDDILSGKTATLTIADLQLSDDKPFVLYESCKASNASYSRSMTSRWGTLCLPYDIAAGENTTCSFYEFEGINNNSIILKEIESGTIAAGTPVLVKKNENQASISFTATDVDLATSPVTSEANDHLVGTFSGVVLKDDANSYFIAKDHFYRVSDYSSNNGVKVNPFRAYLQTTKISRAPMLQIDTETTGINTTTSLVDSLNDTTTECFDINGRRTAGVQKGLNIIHLGNGKTMKVLVK